MLKYSVLIIFLMLVGRLVEQWLNLPLPGTVIGMLLLFLGLFINGEIPKELEKLANILLSHLPLLFIPVSVGIMRYFDLIEKQVVLLFLAISSSTFLTLIISGWIMESRLKK